MNLHYTKIEMVEDLMSMIPFEQSDTVLDSGSGKNKVWYNLCKQEHKYECEVEDGCDFFEWSEGVDWVIGNPPFHLGWKFSDHASKIANKGIAYLFNINGFNSHTPRRLSILAERGFYLNKIHIVMDKRWFGRYYFMIFIKQNTGLISWNPRPY